MPHVIDAYRSDDRDACVAILRSVPEWLDGADVAHAERHLSPEETRVLRDGDGVPLGFLSRNLRPWDGEQLHYIEIVAVRADLMGDGLGRELMLDAESCVGPGSRIWLEMLEEDPSVPRYRSRRAFYEGMGYGSLGTYPSDGWGPGKSARAYVKAT